MGVTFTAVFDHGLRPEEFYHLPDRFNENRELRAALAFADKQWEEFAARARGREVRPYKDQGIWKWHNLFEPTPKELEKAWADGWYADLAWFPELNLDFGPTSCSFSPRCKWYRFLTIEEVRRQYRDMLWMVLETLERPPIALFVPDSSYCSSKAIWMLEDPLETIIERLRNECGPPSDTLEEIVEYTDGGIVTDGYFVDYFADKKQGIL